MKKYALNNTGKTRYTVVDQTPPNGRILGHYATRKGADAARTRYLADRSPAPLSSAAGPIVQVIEMLPGEWLER